MPLRVLVLAFALALASCATHTAIPTLAPAQGEPQSDGAPAAQVLAGLANPAPVSFVVALPLRNERELTTYVEQISDPDSPTFRHFLSRQQFLARYAPAASLRQSVARELQAAGFATTILDQGVDASGNKAQVERYFSTTLQFRADGADLTAIARAPRFSPLLANANATLIGLDGIPAMQTFSRQGVAIEGQPHSYSPKYGPYLAGNLRQAYQYPSYQDANGAGTTAGIVMASPVIGSDIEGFFKKEGLRTPNVRIQRIDGGGHLGNSTFEATLDVEQSMGTAPGAQAILFSIPNLSPQHVYDAYNAAVKADVTVVNSSFGGCELQYDSASGVKVLEAFDKIFKQGLSQGTTFVASSGDNAALQCSNDTSKGVVWPAMDYYTLAVGGTNLTTTLSANGSSSAYVHEDAFADQDTQDTYWGSGGGYSVLYPRPTYQNGFLSAKGRGVPDISGHMGGLGFSSGGTQCQGVKCNVDDSSDWVLVHGKWTAGIGTSASSPDTVGLLLLICQHYKTKLGLVNPAFYKLAKRHGYFRSGIKGDNGYHSTGTKWDPVLGLGTPIGYHLAGTAAASGPLGTPSNP
jgi:subtilase family serine protease